VGGFTDSAFEDLKLFNYFLICEKAPPNFYLKNYLGTNQCGKVNVQ